MKPLTLQTVFFLALILALVLTPYFSHLARRFGIMDRPGHRKTHKEPVSYLGGLAIFASMILAFAAGVVFFPEPAGFTAPAGLIKGLLILGTALGVALAGLLDDVRSLSPRYKLMGQLVFALFFAFFGFRFEVLHIPGLPPVALGLLSVPVTVFWIISIVNAFNMIDGLDGLAATVAAGSLSLLAAAAALMGNGMELFLAVGVLGAVLGFLPFNWKPARIYLGDAGSGGLGMFLACSLVALGQQYGAPFGSLKDPFFGQPFFYQILIATLLVAYPALEITLSVARRLMRGRPISRGDRGHIHHRLLKAGWQSQGVCLIALAVTLLPGLAAIATIAKYHGVASWLLALFGLLIGLGLATLGFLDFLRPKVLDRLRPHYQVAHHFISMQRIKLRLAENQEEIMDLVNQTCIELGVQGYNILVRPKEGREGGCHFSWERSLEDMREYLDYLKTHQVLEDIHHFRDHLALPGGKGAAHWIFEPVTAEGELDVEYRVLFSEFMGEVLHRLSEVPAPRTGDVVSPPRNFLSRVRSSILRRRSFPREGK